MGTDGVEVYTQRGCAFCARAKALLAARGVKITEHDVTDDEDARSELVARTGAMTLPQISYAGEQVGGFEQLVALDRAGGVERWA